MTVPPADLLPRVCETFARERALGNERIEREGAWFVRQPAAPAIHDANHCSRIRCAAADAIDAVLTEADHVFADTGHRKYFCDALTPAAFEARLVQEDYASATTLHLVLEGELQPGSSPRNAHVEIRAADEDRDWESIRRLQRLNMDERAALRGHRPFDAEVSRQMTDCWRRKTPLVRFWLARAERRDCAFFSSWPGHDGMGMVEYLFTEPPFRGRGIARALIGRAVEDARERGAGAVLIGAAADDTPRLLYAALGFRPLCLTREYLAQPAGGA